MTESSFGARKADGLARLRALDLPVPAFTVIGPQEIEIFAQTQALSAATRAALADLVARTLADGHLPLFAIRTEATSVGPRCPPSVLNVGWEVLAGASRASLRLADGRALLPAALEPAWRERTLGFKAGPAASSPIEALERWVARMYRRMLDEGCVGALIIQRMVIGSLDKRSGNGICCNLPGPPHPSRRFCGVFLPGQQGISLQRGFWGPGEVDLSRLAAWAPEAYEELRRVFAMLERCFDPNPYLELTLEGGRLFFLQLEARQRHVVAGGARP